MGSSKENKSLYNDRVKAYKQGLDDIKKETAMVKGMAKVKTLQPYAQVRIAIENLKSASIHAQMSKLSYRILRIRRDEVLSDARKEIFAALNDLLKVIGSDIDDSLTENKDRLPLISAMTPKQRLELLKGMREVTDYTQEAMGASHKMRWSISELHFKIAILGKNIMDFKEYERSKDPMEEHYQDRRALLQFIVEQCQFAAQEYRSKHELSTKDVNDLHNVRKLFELIKKIHVLTNNRAELEKITTSLDSVNEKIEALMAEKKDKKGKK
ncbi:MAG: hypothetical protein JNM27_04790 [Leptospirales bacterium]|nr:hypothetical protein [Leptospirales bacterium]